MATTNGGMILLEFKAGDYKDRTFIRFPDGIMAEVTGNVGSFSGSGIPHVPIHQHASRVTSLVDYSNDKRAAVKKAAE